MFGAGIDKSPLPSHEIALLVVMLPLIVANVATLAHSGFVRREVVRKWCRDNTSSLMSSAASWISTAEEDTPLGRHILAALRAREAQNMRELSSLFNVAALATTASVVLKLIIHSPRWMSFGQTVALIIYLAGLTLMRLFCGGGASSRPGLFYAFTMLCCCIYVATIQGSFDTVVISECSLVFFRSIATVRFHRLRTMAMWNVAYFSCAAHMIFSEFPEEARNFMVYQIWALFFMFFLSGWSTKVVVDRLHEEAKTAAVRSESSGLWNLLDLVCDVVVPLDEHLRIIDKAPRFSALVMMQGKDLEGTCLKDYMPEHEDREAFERCAISPPQSPAEETMPRAVHVKLRDGLGNLIRAELFCVQVQQLSGKTHFVGIREFSDCAPLPEFKRFGAPALEASPTFMASRGVSSGSGDSTETSEMSEAESGSGGD